MTRIILESFPQGVHVGMAGLPSRRRDYPKLGINPTVDGLFVLQGLQVRTLGRLIGHAGKFMRHRQSPGRQFH